MSLHQQIKEAYEKWDMVAVAENAWNDTERDALIEVVKAFPTLLDELEKAHNQMLELERDNDELREERDELHSKLMDRESTLHMYRTEHAAMKEALDEITYRADHIPSVANFARHILSSLSKEEQPNEFKTECYVCGKDVEDYEPQMCCDGRECGCMGMPIEPPLCSSECTEIVFGKHAGDGVQ